MKINLKNTRFKDIKNTVLFQKALDPNWIKSSSSVSKEIIYDASEF